MGSRDSLRASTSPLRTEASSPKCIGSPLRCHAKNISAQPLNIPAEELTERFIRGDVARNTEGSGLGLSIAQSLTELQGGKFELYLDGDLFKVCLKFPMKKKSEPTSSDMLIKSEQHEKQDLNM